jgi:hypothetical protein
MIAQRDQGKIHRRETKTAKGEMITARKRTTGETPGKINTTKAKFGAEVEAKAVIGIITTVREIINIIISLETGLEGSGRTVVTRTRNQNRKFKKFLNYLLISERKLRDT